MIAAHPHAPAPRAVLLDALGTLIGIEPPWTPFVRLLEDRHAITITLDQAVGALRAEMAYYRTHCLAAGDPASLADLRAACSGVVARELGGPVARLDRQALTQTLLDALRFAAYADVVPALKRLRDRGIRLVVLSNWDISLYDALASAGLAGLVDGVVCSAEHGQAKPAPGIFAAALELAGLPADQAIHVGDSYVEDVLGARAAGIEPVLLTRSTAAGGLIGAQSSTASAAVETIASLAELTWP